MNRVPVLPLALLRGLCDVWCSCSACCPIHLYPHAPMKMIDTCMACAQAHTNRRIQREREREERERERASERASASGVPLKAT